MASRWVDAQVNVGGRMDGWMDGRMDAWMCVRGMNAWVGG